MHGRYYTLDGMRGVAAIAVVLHHIGLAVNEKLAQSGHIAVDFFFALSGFVLALAYTKRLSEGIGFLRFMQIRAIRLYPLFVIGLLIGLVKAVGQIALRDPNALSPAGLTLSFITGLFMLPTPIPDLVSMFPLNTPAWSLFLEMMVSTIFALFLFRFSNRSLFIVCLSSAIIYVIGVNIRGDGSLGVGWSSFHFGLSRIFFAFPLGILIHRFFGKNRVIKSPAAFAFVAALIAILMSYMGSHVRVVFDIVSVFIFIPVILIAGIHWEVGRLWQPLFSFLGDISYPVYIIHFPILRIGLAINERLDLPIVPFIFSLLVGIITLSTGLVYYIDDPVRSWLNRRFG